jgi:hypothetical protein
VARPRPEVTDLTRRARATGVRVAALSNSWGTGSYDPYAGWGMMPGLWARAGLFRASTGVARAAGQGTGP